LAHGFGLDRDLGYLVGLSSHQLVVAVDDGLMPDASESKAHPVVCLFYIR
jgi:hypothetical protein